MIFWVIGFVLAMVSAAFVREEVEIDPYSDCSTMLIAVWGFAVFPVLNYLVAIIAFIMVADAREKRKARKEGKIK